MCTYNHIHTQCIYIYVHIYTVYRTYLYIYTFTHSYIRVLADVSKYHPLLHQVICFLSLHMFLLLLKQRNHHVLLFFLPGAQQCLWRSFVSQHDGCKTQAEFQTLRPTVGLWIWVLQSHTLQSHRSGFASSCLFNYRCRWKNWKMKHLLPKDGYKSRH